MVKEGIEFMVEINIKDIALIGISMVVFWRFGQWGGACDEPSTQVSPSWFDGLKEFKLLQLRIVFFNETLHAAPFFCNCFEGAHGMVTRRDGIFRGHSAPGFGRWVNPSFSK